MHYKNEPKEISLDWKKVTPPTQAYRVVIEDFNSEVCLNETLTKAKENFPNYGAWVKKV